MEEEYPQQAFQLLIFGSRIFNRGRIRIGALDMGLSLVVLNLSKNFNMWLITFTF